VQRHPAAARAPLEQQHTMKHHPAEAPFSGTLKQHPAGSSKAHHFDSSTQAHTCSEQSLRILMWNASCVQKHSIKPDRKSMKIRSEKNLEVCISTSLLDANRSLPDIKFGLNIV